MLTEPHRSADPGMSALYSFTANAGVKRVIAERRLKVAFGTMTPAQYTLAITCEMRSF